MRKNYIPFLVLSCFIFSRVLYMNLQRLWLPTFVPHLTQVGWDDVGAKLMHPHGQCTRSSHHLARLHSSTE